MIELTIEKADQRFLNRFRWPRVAARWAEEVGPAAVARVREKAPVGKKDADNGQLRDSITYRSRISATSATVEIVSSAPYAGYVIHGTPPHIILPRNARVLHWVEGGNHFYRYRVNHPGAKANPFPENALRATEPLIERNLVNEVIRAVRSE